jgi:hypothetical protein
LVEDDEVHFLCRDFRRDLGEVEDRAGETIEPRHYELVAFADERQRLAERFALVAAGPALLLFEDLLATVGVEFVELGLKILPDGRDAGVSDFHVSHLS